MEESTTPNLEAKLREIRDLLEKMQGGNLGFDENVKLFTRGTELISECRTYLDQAEMSVKQLIGEDGQEEELPFD